MFTLTLLKWTKLGDVGSFIGGLSAALALLFAVYAGKKTIPERLEEWKKQKVKESRARTAAVALASIHGFLDALRFAANPLAISTSSDATENRQRENPSQVMRKHYYSRWDIAKEATERFLAAWTESRIYLDDEIVEVFRSIWNHRAHMLSSGELWLMYVEISNPSDEERRMRTEAFKSAIGQKATGPLDGFQSKAENLLLKLIRYED